MGRRWGTADGDGVSFWSDEDGLKEFVVMVAHLCAT